MTNKTRTPDGIPFSPEAEEAAIGSVLTNPDMYILAGAYLKSTDFFLKRHEWIWEAIGRVIDRHEAVDILTVSAELKAHGHLDEIGGTQYLIRLVNNTPTSANAEYYAKLVYRASLRRQLMDKLEKGKALARDESVGIERVMSEIEGSIFAVTQQAVERSEQTMAQAISEASDEIEKRMNGVDEFYMPTGFKAVDRTMGGLERGCLHIIGGRPGMGKSSFCLGVAVNAARMGVRVFYVSTEMPTKRLAMRALSMDTGINLMALKQGAMNDREVNRFVEAMGRLQGLPLQLDYIPAASVTQVRAKVARMQREKGIDLLIIDGLWQMTAPEIRINDRDQINGWIGNRLVDCAKQEFNIPILLAHQLNRNCEHRPDHRPIMSDLDYGGQLERHADVIMLLYRDEVYDEATEFPNRADVIFAKNRDGGNGVVSLYFDKKITRFLDSTAQNIDLSSYARPSARDEEVMQ
jgi:replicative DNA helicase